MVCMFDAEEAHAGIKPETHRYFNGELFRELRALVSQDSARLERFILVFNKYDLLRRHYPKEVTDHELLLKCITAFSETFGLLRGVVNEDRMCEVLTILTREGMVYKNQGAPHRQRRSFKRNDRSFRWQGNRLKTYSGPCDESVRIVWHECSGVCVISFGSTWPSKDTSSIPAAASRGFGRQPLDLVSADVPAGYIRSPAKAGRGICRADNRRGRFPSSG